MENEIIIVLPAEVAQIAENVSVEKRNEVQSVLNHVFNGVTKMREQLDAITVSSPDDKVNMKLANTIRLGVRQVRLDAEKVFDAKRSEVQNAMLSYKTEDALWLKAKQTMQILTKEIEENARWKEETRLRFEAEQKELKVQERILNIQKFNPEISRTEFENMSDEMFKFFLASIEKQYNDKIEAERQAELARVEAERKVKLHNERKEIAIPYYAFWTDFEKTLNFGEQSETDFNAFIDRIKKAKSDHETEQERIKAELAKEKEASERREKEMESERKKQADLLEAQRKENERIQREKDAENARLAKELQDKKNAEEKAKAEADKKEKERIAAEAKAAKAPDKEKLLKWVNDVTMPNLSLSTIEGIGVAQNIDTKFASFKVWAKNLIETL